MQPKKLGSCHDETGIFLTKQLIKKAEPKHLKQVSIQIVAFCSPRKNAFLRNSSEAAGSKVELKDLFVGQQRGVCFQYVSENNQVRELFLTAVYSFQEKLVKLKRYFIFWNWRNKNISIASSGIFRSGCFFFQSFRGFKYLPWFILSRNQSYKECDV